MTGGDSSCSSRPQCGRSFNLIGCAEGKHDAALKWFSNYLQPRSCCVNIAKEYFKDISLTFFYTARKLCRVCPLLGACQYPTGSYSWKFSAAWIC